MILTESHLPLKWSKIIFNVKDKGSNFIAVWWSSFDFFIMYCVFIFFCKANESSLAWYGAVSKHFWEEDNKEEAKACSFWLWSLGEEGSWVSRYNSFLILSPFFYIWRFRSIFLFYIIWYFQFLYKIYY